MPSMPRTICAHDLRLLRIAEIEIVGDGERQRAHRGEVAPGFGDRLLGALERIGVAIARRHVGGDRQRLLACRARARPPHRRPAAAPCRPSRSCRTAPTPSAASTCPATPRIFFSDSSTGLLRVERRIARVAGAALRERPLIERRFVGQRRDRHVGDDLALVLHDQPPGVGRDADHREIQFPFLEDALRLPPRGPASAPPACAPGSPTASSRRRVMFASRCGTLSRSSSMPLPPLSRHLGRRGGEARRAHVLDRDDRVRRHQLEARFEQQLLGERIADLHGRALLLRILVELGRRHGRAMDAVAPGLRADIDDRIARALRPPIGRSCRCAPGPRTSR